MSDLVAIAYDNPQTAQEVRDALADLSKEKLIELDDHAGSARATGRLRALDDAREQARRDRKVVKRTLRTAELSMQSSERLRITIVTVDVAQLRGEPGEGVLVQRPVLLEALTSTLMEMLDVPARVCHADHLRVQTTATDHRLQRREDLLVGKITSGPEEDEGVARGVAAH
jgi:hypothetical protein